MSKGEIKVIKYFTDLQFKTLLSTKSQNHRIIKFKTSTSFLSVQVHSAEYLDIVSREDALLSVDLTLPPVKLALSTGQQFYLILFLE